MTKLKFIEADGKEHDVEAREGESVMQAAVSHLVPGIVAECGGFASCVTCHGYVDEAWKDKLPPPDDAEAVGPTVRPGADRRGADLGGEAAEAELGEQFDQHGVRPTPVQNDYGFDARTHGGKRGPRGPRAEPQQDLRRG